MPNPPCEVAPLFHSQFPLRTPGTMAPLLEIFSEDPVIHGISIQSPVLVGSSCCSKMPWTGWLKQQAFISHCSGGWKSKVKVPVWSGSGEGSLPGLKMAAFSLSPPVGSPQCRTLERESSAVSSSPEKDANPIMSGPPSRPHLTCIISQRLYFQILSRWEQAFHCMHLGAEHQHSAYNTSCRNHIFLLLSCTYYGVHSPELPLFPVLYGPMTNLSPLLLAFFSPKWVLRMDSVSGSWQVLPHLLRCPFRLWL